MSKNKIDLIENNKNLINLYFNKNNNEYSYRLIFRNKKELYEAKNSLESISDIISVKVDLN